METYLYLFGEVDWEKQQTINHEVELIMEGGSAASHVGVKEVLKLSLYSPLENKSLENVHRDEIVYSILLPRGHPALNYLKEHIKCMDCSCSQCETIETMDLAKQPAKGIYHLRYLSLHLNKYWRDQTTWDLDEQLPKADALMEKIESGENWQPCMMCPRSQSTDPRDVLSDLRKGEKS